MDTQILVDCIQNKATIEYILEETKVGGPIAISTIVKKEACGILVFGGSFSEERFSKDFEQVKGEINGKVKRYDPKQGDEEAKRLLGKHSKLKKGEKDHKILAHYKGIGIDGMLVRDSDFEDVIKREGLNVIRIPTQQKTVSWKLSRFRH